MRRLLRFMSVAVMALTTLSCATLTVSSHVERGLPFARYRTYDWGPPDALPTGDPQLDKDPFFQDYVQGAIERGLAARGFERVAAGEPDLLIHYHASISKRIDVNRTDREYGYCWDEACTARVVEYKAGTLVLDLVDARTNRVMWRGWAQDSLDGVLGNHDRMARKINEAVRRMLERLPRPL